MKDKEIKNEDINSDEELDDVTFEESNEDGFALPKKDQMKKMREKLKTCQKEKESYLTGWQRAKADYVNIQKELDNLRKDSTNIAKESMVNNLLPVLDSFNMAFSNKDAWEKVDKEWRTGIEYIYQQFINGLLNSNIYKIDKTGVLFNPEIHNSIKVIDTKDKKMDHTIAEITQIGYRIGDLLDESKVGRVIRPATVTIYEYKK